ncbi:MAG: hypothetical protein HKP42_05630, partial [Maribacter sp.]|nr:hypothetical protein [Maribacter sp.]
MPISRYFRKLGLVWILFMMSAQFIYGQIVDIPDFELEGCNADWPKFLVTKWKDKCGGAGEINSDDGIFYGSSEDGCTEYRLYTFTLLDKCGNDSKETTVVSRDHDLSSPEIADLEDFKLVACNSPWPDFLETVWKDNCSNGGEIESDAGVDEGTSADG